MSHFPVETTRKQVNEAKARVNSLLQQQPEIQLIGKGACVISIPERVETPNAQQNGTMDEGAKTLHSHDLASVLDGPGGSTSTTTGNFSGDGNLVDVHISQAVDVVRNGMDSQIQEGTWALDLGKALVAGLKQPQDKCCCVDPIGLSGGLALWWKEEVDIEVRWKSKNIIRCILSWPNIPGGWLGTFIYAPPRRQQRASF
ncbi:hypothetical protein Vadar_012854 [Vaccinium darrowii]|uniref:Uncharacterized protein n=1 Tax=Vaccinium darrowii TaxID=229202 RepID=A0ACB7X9E5_9ERIC|nr:hypothetical protein Vadar_012854 [Vaccinium darrowii]